MMPSVNQDCIPLSAFVPNPRRVNLIFSDAKHRPPILEEMQDDIDGLAHKLSVKYTDQSCVQLHYDELVADCAYKLAKVIDRGDVERLPNRHEFFKYIKTVFNNHVKSQVGRWRLTRKRGGQRRNEDGDDTHVSLHPVKNSDVHTDDPDQHMQLADPASLWRDASSFIEDISCYLTPIEQMILREFDEPGARTLAHATIDASVGRKIGEQPTLKIEFKHYAAGLGLELEVFKSVLARLGSKVKQLRMNDLNDQPIEWNLAVSRLEELFEVQIPESLEKPVIRRLLTLAAVDQFNKVGANPQAKADLQTIGAKVPELKSNRTLSCFGVLYQRNNRACAACQLKQACGAEAANYGLEDITLSPRLLGAKQVRVPVIVSASPEELACLSSPRDEEIFYWLRSNLELQLGEGEIIFRHKDTRLTAAVVELCESFKLRVVKPSAEVKAALKKAGPSYYLPEDMSAQLAISTLGEHIHQMFVAMA